MGELGSYKVPFAPLTFEEREAVASALLAELGFDRDNPLRVNLRVPKGDIHRTAARKHCGYVGTCRHFHCYY